MSPRTVAVWKRSKLVSHTTKARANLWFCSICFSSGCLTDQCPAFMPEVSAAPAQASAGSSGAVAVEASAAPNAQTQLASSAQVPPLPAALAGIRPKSEL